MDKNSHYYRIARRDQLPLEFEGWQRAHARTVGHVSGSSFELELWETVGGNWVSVHTCTPPGESTTSIHATRDEAVETMGYGRLARLIRDQLGYPDVERIA